MGQIFCSMLCQMFYYRVKYLLGKYFIICSVSIFGDILSPKSSKRLFTVTTCKFLCHLCIWILIWNLVWRNVHFFPLQEILLFFDGFWMKNLWHFCLKPVYQKKLNTRTSYFWWYWWRRWQWIGWSLQWSMQRFGELVRSKQVVLGLRPAFPLPWIQYFPLHL